MILQALHEYYDRMASSNPGELSEMGFERKAIPVIIELTPDGLLHQINVDRNKKFVSLYILPKAVKKTVNIAANLFWDNSEYALGFITAKSEKKKNGTEKVRQRHENFVERIEQIDIDDENLNDSDKTALTALKNFLRNLDLEKLRQRKDFDDEFFQSNPNVSFKLSTHNNLICERPAIRKVIQQISIAKENKKFCLITGTHAPIARLHPSIKGVWGAKSSGANIVSFNLKSFQSFNKRQGENAPVSELAAFKYTESLNYLLRTNSTQRAQIGDSSTVFWSEKGSKTIESAFHTVMGFSDKNDPQKGVAKVKSALESFRRGRRISTEDDQRFYVLGLAPNSARISVRFWNVITIKDLSNNILQHYKDISICHSPKDNPETPISTILSHLCLEYKISNLRPNLAGEVTRSILNNNLYPHALLEAAVRRNKAERRITFCRAALIKACLNRQARDGKLIQQELDMVLDKKNSEVPYLMGRWFATLEKIQQDSHPGINATIRDRYYGAISSNPVTAFSILDRLKNHHLAKLQNKGARVNYEKLLDEIVAKLPAQPPSYFSLREQGVFAIGYHHQRHDFFQPKAPKPTN